MQGCKHCGWEMKGGDILIIKQDNILVCPKCGKHTEVFSRVVGYLKPIQNWNPGKVEEFKRRKYYSISDINKLDKKNEVK